MQLTKSFGNLLEVPVKSSYLNIANGKLSKNWALFFQTSKERGGHKKVSRDLHPVPSFLFTALAPSFSLPLTQCEFQSNGPVVDITLSFFKI